MLTNSYSARFRKDYKIVPKRGYDIALFEEVVWLLCEEKPLPPKYRDHALTGNYGGQRECYILPDWLLVYKVEKEELLLYLTRTGKHNDLF